MGKIPIVAIGPLGRDIVYIKDEDTRELRNIGVRGGGSLWNVLVNSRVNGAESLAFCVSGSDQASRISIDDLQKAGVILKKHNLQQKKITRTVHEILSMKSIRLGKPKHEFKVRCPICNSETYRRGTARLTRKFMNETESILRNLSSEGVIIHIDGLDSTRFSTLKNLGNSGIIKSLDLGRSTGLFRMQHEALFERLNCIDILFIHSKVLPTLKRMAARSSEKDLMDLFGLKIMVITRGKKGASIWIRNDDNIIGINQSPVQAKKLVDTAGAGDALIGCFLSKIAKLSIKELINFAIAPKEIEDILFESQKWAAFKCGFAGARGHIAGSNGETWSWDLKSNTLKTTGTDEEYRLMNLNRTSCIACNSKIVETSQTSISTLRFRRNVITLPDKIKKAWSNRNEYPWINLATIEAPGYVIGTGGSYVVANFIASLLSQHTNNLFMPIRPFDFIRLGKNVNSAIFISNSGKTPDIISSLKYSIEIKIPRIAVITGEKQSELDEYLRSEDDLLLCTGANGERGFLSVAGIIVPCFMIWAALRNNQFWHDEKGYLNFHRLFENAKNKAGKVFSKLEKATPEGISSQRIVVLGGGYAWPAMLDFESKMVESGLGQPELSEIKDYSHGRFVSSINSRIVKIICGMPDDKPYRDFLIDRLTPKKKVIEITTDYSGAKGSLELLLQIEHIMRLIAERESYDLSGPMIPSKGLELYRYPDILNFSNSDKKNK